MTLFSVLPFVAAACSLLLAVASILRTRRSLAAWCFFAGMIVLSMDSLCIGFALRATALPEVAHWLARSLVVKSFVPVTWLCFSLTYSRGDYRRSLARWRLPLAILALLPVGLSLIFREQLLLLVPSDMAAEPLRIGTDGTTTALNAILLVALVLILMNLEQTFRSAVGTMRWRIKFVVLGLAVIFATSLYVRSQAILFSTQDLALAAIEPSSVLVGCLFLAVAYARTGLAEIDVYPSRAVVRSSLTLLVVGAYLFIVGVLAQIVRRFGGAESLQLQALVVLLGLAGLAVLLLSDRLRQRLHGFVGRHFAKAQHDSVRIWTDCSKRLANVKDRDALCAAAARLISETFDVLSASVWLLDERSGRLVAGASSARRPVGSQVPGETVAASSAVGADLRERRVPFDLDAVNEPWAQSMREQNPVQFPNGGRRWCVPLRTAEGNLGAIVLADRVNGARYTAEELELLQCIADQVTSVLLNLRLANEVARAREMEAFRTMSAFFVHDLKNAAASLNLMLKNLPVHFDDPAFRQDALRGIGNTARRIDEMITRLTALRRQPDSRREEADLNRVVGEALGGLDGTPDVELTRELRPLPPIFADSDQIRAVVTNLLLNARDALGPHGRIHVRTDDCGDRVVLSVADNGCGMSSAFLENSLFRPFQSTKKKGLGIGMFQSRMAVEAHGGSIVVESEAGRGTTVQVSLPARQGK